MADEKEKSSDGKVTVSIRLPAELVEVVDRKAEEELRSRSAQIQRILEESTADKNQPAGKK